MNSAPFNTLAVNGTTVLPPNPTLVTAQFLSDNAAYAIANGATGVDPVTGPWQLCAPFSFGGRNYPLPPTDAGGRYQYKLATDPAAGGLAFVPCGPLSLDVAGHDLSFANFTVGAGAQNDYFLADTPGTFPTGWTDLCVESHPCVMQPAAQGLPNYLHAGKANLLAWDCDAAHPTAATVTQGVGGAATFTVAGVAPSPGQQVKLFGFGGAYVYSTDFSANNNTWYYVHDNPTGSSFTVTRFLGGAAVLAPGFSPLTGTFCPGSALPVPAHVTWAVDGSSNVVWTVATGVAPAPGRQVYLSMSAGTPASLTGQPFATRYEDNYPYWVVDNPTGTKFTVSHFPPTDTRYAKVQAASVPAAAANSIVAFGQVVQSAALTVPTTLSSWAFSANIAQPYPHGFGNGGQFATWAAFRVVDATSGQLFGSFDTTTGQPHSGYWQGHAVGGGFTPYCNIQGFKPPAGHTVYLQFIAFNVVYDSTKPIPTQLTPLWADGLHAGQVSVWGVLAAKGDYQSLAGYNGIPLNWVPFPNGATNPSPYVYTAVGDVAIFDSVGGGTIRQGAGRPYYSPCVQNQGGANKLSITGLSPSQPLNMTVTGNDGSFLIGDVTSPPWPFAGQHKTCTNINATYGPNVAVQNRQAFTGGFHFPTTWGDITLDHITINNLPQDGIVIGSAGKQYTEDAGFAVAISNLLVHGNAQCQNAYGILITNGQNVTVSNYNYDGVGVAHAVYTLSNNATLTDNLKDILFHDFHWDCTEGPDPEYGGNLPGRAVKIKNVEPGPWPGYDNVCYRDGTIICRCGAVPGTTLQAGTGSLPVQFDNRNGNVFNGGFRFLRVTFESRIDNTPGLYSAAIGCDQVNPTVWPTFEDCTFRATHNAVRLFGPDGDGAQGLVLTRPTIEQLPVTGLTLPPFQAVAMDSHAGTNYGLPSNGTMILSPTWVNVPDAGKGIYWWGGPGYGMAMEAYGSVITNPGAYTGSVVPSATWAGQDLSGNPTTVRMTGGSPNGVLGVDFHGANISAAGTNPNFNFSGGSPTTPAVGHVAAFGAAWPYRDVRSGHSLRLTITTDGTTPLAGATATLVDSNGLAVYPDLWAASGVTGVSDGTGRVGLWKDQTGFFDTDIPLPTYQVMQSAATDSPTVQKDAQIDATCLLDGTSQIYAPTLTNGPGHLSVLASPSFTLTVTALGYSPHVETLTPTGPLAKVVSMGALAPALSVSPSSVVAGSTTALTLTDPAAAWVSGTPGLPDFGFSAGTKLGQTVLDLTHATPVNFTAPGTPGTVTITDPISGATATLTITGVVLIPSFTISPSSVVAGSTTALNMVGTNTAWGPGQAFTASAGSIPVQTNVDGTHQTLSFTDATPGTVTFTDPSTGATATLTVTAAPVAVSTGIHPVLARLLFPPAAPFFVPPPTLVSTGVPPFLALLLFRPSAPGAPLPPDLLSALVAYLRSAPTLAALLTVGGEVQVWDEEGAAVAHRPYVLVKNYSENLPGETAEDQPVGVTLAVMTEGVDQARSVGAAVKAALDHPAGNPNSLGRALFVWQGGREGYLFRDASRPQRLPGKSTGGRYVYEETINYQFWVTPEQ